MRSMRFYYMDLTYFMMEINFQSVENVKGKKSSNNNIIIIIMEKGKKFYLKKGISLKKERSSFVSIVCRNFVKC